MSITGPLCLVLLLVVVGVEAQCPSLPAGDEFVIGPVPDKSSYAVREKVTYTCAKPGYQIAGTNGDTKVNLRCRGNGKFNGARPCCEKISCTSPPDGINTVPILDAEKVAVGTVYNYTCERPFLTTDPVTTECQPNGTWSQPAPNCTNTECVYPWIQSDLGICYLLSKFVAKWVDAKNDCIDRGGSLAMPKNVTDMEDLAAISGVESDRLWLGGGQLGNGTDADYTWLDGTVVTTTTPSSFVQSTPGREMLTFRFLPPSYILSDQYENMMARYICQKN